MAEIKDWQRQNMKKVGDCPAPFNHTDKVHVSGVTSSMHSKIAPPTHGMGGLVSAPVKVMAPLRMADGGDVSEARDKEEGLKASANEKVGFFERLRMGNIDDPKSEAYNRFGAGRAKADRDEQSRKDEYAAINAAASKKEEPVDLSLPSDDARAGVPAEEPKRTSFAELRAAEKDTSPAPAKPARSAARTVKPAPVGGGRGTMADDPRRVDRPAPAADTNPRRPMLQSERDKQNRESFEQVPLVRAGRAVADFFSGADKRFLQSKMDRGEALTEVEKAQARRAGLM